MRKIIFHYHLFKNAGTSVDAILKESFGANMWVTKEFPDSPAINKAEVQTWITQTPHAMCFSSHTALLPPPILEGVTILPVIFVRHPFDRIISAYLFECKQKSDGFGAVLARNTSLSGYIETRLSLPDDRQCRNFHVQRFSGYIDDNTESELVRAQKAISQLPFVGIVEQFDESLKRLEGLLKKEFSAVIPLKQLKKNVTRSTDKCLEERLLDLRANIGNILFEKLLEANKDDILFYNYVLRLS